VDDPIWRMGMQPIETTRGRPLAYVSRNRDHLPVIEDHQMLMNMQTLAFHAVAGDSRDHRWHLRKELATGRRGAGRQERDGEYSSGSQDAGSPLEIQ
jgi:O-glycosyl hydrolase